MTDQAQAGRKLTTELIRGAFMVLFFVAARLVGVLVAALALFLFLCALTMRRPNGNARRFGKGLSWYLAEIVQFLTYNTQRKPWPFSPWPRTGLADPGHAED